MSRTGIRLPHPAGKFDATAISLDPGARKFDNGVRRLSVGCSIFDSDTPLLDADGSIFNPGASRFGRDAPWPRREPPLLSAKASLFHVFRSGEVPSSE